MRYVIVRFNNVGKNYTYKTNLDLRIGWTYKIKAKDGNWYSNPVKVVGYEPYPGYVGDLREIDKVEVVTADERPNDMIKQVWFNKKKGTTVVLWNDETKTMVKCHPDDEWDKEKALAMCYVKRLMDNRGCYNEIFKKWCGDDE